MQFSVAKRPSEQVLASGMMDDPNLILDEFTKFRHNLKQQYLLSPPPPPPAHNDNIIQTLPNAPISRKSFIETESRLSRQESSPSSVIPLINW